MEFTISHAPATNRATIFAIIATALFMSSLDVTIVATAIHDLQVSLGTSVVLAGWTITAYSLGLIIMLPLSGRLADRVGRKGVFLGSILTFGIASLLCGLAPNIYLLIFFRVLQAAGGAGFTPTATGIVVEHFGPSRDKFVGLFGSIFPIGSMAGPVFGGVLVEFLSWRDVFFVNVPIIAVLIPLAIRFLPADNLPEPDTPAPGKKPSWDVFGTLLLSGALTLTMFGLAVVDADSPTTFWVAAVLVTLGIAMGAWFIRHISSRPDPLIPPRLIYGSGFGAVNIVNMVYGGGVAAMAALVPLYATTRYGLGALQSGTVLVAQSLGAILMSLVGTALLRRTGYRIPIYSGAAAMAIGLTGLFVAPPISSPYVWLALCTGMIGLGAGWSSPASRNAGLQLSPKDAGSLAALRTTSRNIGQIAFISITTIVISLAASPTAAHAGAYLAAAVLLILCAPIIHRVPEQRGAW